MTAKRDQRADCGEPGADFSALSALYLNCTLKRSGRLSHTETLMQMSKAIMDANSVATQLLRVVDLDLPPGVEHDMTEHGFERDAWPAVFERVLAADILVIGTPVWLGEKSSVCRRLIERLYGESGTCNARGQSVYYGRAGGCIVTGNEDGLKHCAMTVLFALQHVGYAIPPQADAGWVGDAGPGPPTPTRIPAARRTISPSATPPS